MLRLTDDQWERIREHFPEESIPESRPGRKPIPARSVLEAVLWILNTGAQWHMLPQSLSKLQDGGDGWWNAISHGYSGSGALVVRWEYYASNFLGFVELASITMLLKRI